MLQFHVAISLVGILSGLAMLYGLLLGQNFKTAIAVFFLTTILTSPSGFPLPPFAIVQGIVLLIFIALGIAATIKFRPIDDRRWAGR